MIDCRLILSISLVLFSIIAASWWSFFAILQNFNFGDYLNTDMSILLIGHIYIWTISVLALLFIAILSSAYDLIISSEQINFLANIFFVSSFFPFFISVWSQMKMATEIFRFHK